PARARATSAASSRAERAASQPVDTVSLATPSSDAPAGWSVKRAAPGTGPTAGGRRMHHPAERTGGSDLDLLPPRDLAAKVLGGLEDRHCSRRDLDAGARARIAGHARLPLPHLE